MIYYSTKNKHCRADFRTATIEGQPADRGLYFPSEIPLLSSSFLREVDRFSFAEIAEKVIRPYVGDCLPQKVLARIVAQTVNFEFPLVPVEGHSSALELYHGPTLAFKDVGARFMSRCLGYFAQGENRPYTVLVATSGDTGGAVAHAFADIEGVSVIVLYPSGKVSRVQEAQLTTLGDTVQAVEIDGSFDDCQRLAKQAFADPALAQRYRLTSANSINVARWLPQQFYYFFAWRQWADKSDPPVVSVPSGNFGNLCAGLLAARSGLPVRHFIAACNANDAVARYLTSGIYAPLPAVPTLSNAMDVGDPSNFARLLELFQHDLPALRLAMSAVSVDDQTTKKVIARLYRNHHYLADPHGAVAYQALQAYLTDNRSSGYFLQTAHPVKFVDVIEPIIESALPLPSTVAEALNRKKKAVALSSSYSEFKEWMMR